MRGPVLRHEMAYETSTRQAARMTHSTSLWQSLSDGYNR